MCKGTLPGRAERANRKARKPADPGSPEQAGNVPPEGLDGSESCRACPSGLTSLVLCGRGPWSAERSPGWGPSPCLPPQQLGLCLPVSPPVKSGTESRSHTSQPVPARVSQGASRTGDECADAWAWARWGQGLSCPCVTKMCPRHSVTPGPSTAGRSDFLRTGQEAPYNDAASPLVGGRRGGAVAA